MRFSVAVLVTFQVGQAITLQGHADSDKPWYDQVQDTLKDFFTPYGPPLDQKIDTAVHKTVHKIARHVKKEVADDPDDLSWWATQIQETSQEIANHRERLTTLEREVSSQAGDRSREYNATREHLKDVATTQRVQLEIQAAAMIFVLSQMKLLADRQSTVIKEQEDLIRNAGNATLKATQDKSLLEKMQNNLRKMAES